MKELLGRRCSLAAAVIVLASLSIRASADSLDQVTVQAQRETLRKQVDQFFHSAMLKPLFDESVLRWENAVCPMVVGMIRPAGEFVLRRLSELARESGVPLAKEECKHPNLYIIVAKNPETFLKLWWRRQPRMYNTGRGIVVIDPAQVEQLNIGQFADYIAMVSFVEVNQDADLGANSTILNLFATSSAAAPLEMTRWDKALLRGLYASDHRSRMQMSQMETRAVNFLQSKPSP